LAVQQKEVKMAKKKKEAKENSYVSDIKRWMKEGFIFEVLSMIKNKIHDEIEKFKKKTMLFICAVALLIFGVFYMFNSFIIFMQNVFQMNEGLSSLIFGLLLLLIGMIILQAER
jgi:hypothetical protein